MIKHITAGLAVAVLSGLTAMATAQDSAGNQVAAKTDWSVFIDDDPKICWGVSAPKESRNTRDGRIVSVSRGDILLFVTFRPGDEVAGEVSFTGGYEFANGSTVSVDVGGTTYELFTEGEWAWPANASDDAKLLTSLKRGSQAVVTGVSERSGTTTRDTFSLLGFTAAFEEAESRCTG
ncbi:MAG: invasion associated locus B family protein [Pseudomonadota bacterium]